MRVPYFFLLIVMVSTTTFIFVVAKPPLEFLFVAAGLVSIMFATVPFIVKAYSGNWAVVNLESIIKSRPAAASYDTSVIKRIKWILPKNEDLNEFANSVMNGTVTDDVLERVDRAIPQLKKAADRRSKIVLGILFASIGLGSACRIISAILRHHG